VQSKVTTKPSIQPVTLDEVKASLRITNTAEDALLTQYIEDATLYAEDFMGRKLINQTITSYYSTWNELQTLHWNGVKVGSINHLSGGGSVDLQYAPAISITTVHLIDTDNSETLYASSNYYLDNFDNDVKPSIVLNEGASITGNLRAKNSIKVVWQAGYGTLATDVPSVIRRGILTLIGGLYSNRGDCSIGDCAEGCGVNKMLKQYKFYHAI